ncbi:MAG TPA: hypothetical protein VF865_07130 [Acidobacteriaceae bacterium]
MTLQAFRTTALSLSVAAALSLAAASAPAQQNPYPAQQPNPYPNSAQQPATYPAQQPNAYPRPGQQQNDRDRDRDRRNDQAEGPHNWTTDQIVTATVHQAWVLSNRNEASFFEIVKELAEISAHNRNLILPDDPAAGRRAGEYIKEQARADHDQLLYDIVDKSVRMTGKPASPESANAR